jgi:hypothetical protein
MKKSVFTLLVLVLSVSVWFVGCSSEEEGQMAEKEMAMATPATTVFVQHDVADYAAWRPLYDADAARRAEAGLKDIGVYQDADNPNTVLVVWETNNVAAFKAMLADPELAEKMKEAGVTSTPETWVGGDLHAGAGVTFVRHEVADYDAWRPEYDADAARRMESGLEEMGVYRSADDPNMVLMMFSAADGNAAKLMLESEELAAKMKDAGVVSKPEAWMADANMKMSAAKE